MNRLPLTGLILAGGESRRMGGNDKAWLNWQGRSLIEQLLAALQPQVDRCLISANRQLARYAALGLPVLPDFHLGGQGPLAGIAAGLAAIQHSGSDYLLTCPTDTLNLPPDYAQRMLAQAPSVASLGGHLQPTFLLLSADHLKPLLTYLANGERRLGQWARAMQLNTVSFDDIPHALGNVNTPEEFANM